MPDTNPGDKQGNQLKRYWTKGEGAAKIRWGEHHDFDRCVRELGKHIENPDLVKRLCKTYHVAATGFPPGKGHGE